MVKEALEEAEKAQIAAEKAIKQADEDIQGTQNLLTSVRYHGHCKCKHSQVLLSGRCIS